MKVISFLILNYFTDEIVEKEARGYLQQHPELVMYQRMVQNSSLFAMPTKHDMDLYIYFT